MSGFALVQVSVDQRLAGIHATDLLQRHALGVAGTDTGHRLIHDPLVPAQPRSTGQFRRVVAGQNRHHREFMVGKFDNAPNVIPARGCDQFHLPWASLPTGWIPS